LGEITNAPCRPVVQDCFTSNRKNRLDWLQCVIQRLVTSGIQIFVEQRGRAVTQAVAALATAVAALAVAVFQPWLLVGAIAAVAAATCRRPASSSARFSGL
jgi:hypothetical protein